MTPIQANEKELAFNQATEELKNFVGPGNYLQKWQGIRENTSSFAGFNFWAFIFVHSYFFYRKMYTWGAIFIAASLVVSFGIVALYAYIGLKLHFFASRDELMQQAMLLNLVISLIFMLASGFLANKIYLSHATFSIQQISKLNFAHENHMQAIKGKGGVNMAAFFIGIGINIFARIFL